MGLFTEQAKIYAEFHQKMETKYAHIAAILLLFLAGFIFLGFIHIVVPGVLELTVADLFVAGLLIYYFVLNWRLALVLTPILLLLLWISHLISYRGPSAFSLWAFLIIVVLSGILLAIGYYFEGKRPSMRVGLTQLLIEPLFLTAEIFFLAGKMQNLRQEIYPGPKPAQDSVELE